MLWNISFFLFFFPSKLLLCPSSISFFTPALQFSCCTTSITTHRCTVILLQLQKARPTSPAWSSWASARAWGAHAVETPSCVGDRATQEEARHGLGSAGVQALLLAGSFLTHKSDGSERSSCFCCLNSTAAPAKFTTPIFLKQPQKGFALSTQPKTLKRT